MRRRIMLALPAAIATAALFGTPAVAATPANGGLTAAPAAAPAPQTQGIIMRDGGVCDPIRHMGC
jgi:hypothetical protein